MEISNTSIEIIAIITIVSAGIVGFAAAIYMIKNFSK